MYAHEKTTRHTLSRFPTAWKIMENLENEHPKSYIDI